MSRVRTDWVLFLTAVMMVAFGLVVVYSASSVVAEVKYKEESYYFLTRQIAAAVLSFAAMMSIKNRDYRDYRSAGWAFGPLGIVLVLLLAVYFADPRTHRWLRMGPTQFQPAEFAKPALAIFLAYFVTQRANAINHRHTLLPAALAMAMLSGIMVLADLGTALVLVATAAVVFYVAGLSRRYFVLAVAVAIPLATVAVASKPYRLARVVSYVDPDYKILDRVDPNGALKAYMQTSLATRDTGYQARQSKIAVGSGGVLGLGLMQGKQKLLYLPEAHTDFIYAVVGEELGLWGATALLAGFLVILWRGYRLFWSVPDSFGRYLALGMTTTIVVQALINMSVVLDLAPTKGITLPLVSYGGSSLLSAMMSLGVLLSISEHTG